MRTSRLLSQAGSLSALAVVLFSAPSVVRAQNGRGFGSVSTCPAAPQISAAASSFLLSPRAGLTLNQASSGIHAVVQQTVRAAPNMAPQIAQQTIASISMAASSAAQRSEATHNGASTTEALAAPAAAGTTATAGYMAVVQSVVQGAIQGCASTGMNTTDLKNIISAIATTIVTEAAKQSGATAMASKNGDLPAEKSLPMDNAQNAVAVIKAVVSTVTQTAGALGIPPVEIAGSINRAGQDSIATAKNLSSDVISSAVAGQTAGQVASQVASQVAQQVAQQVAKEVAAQVNQVTKDVQKSQNQNSSGNSQNTPNTLPIAPGQPIIPGGNAAPTVLTRDATPTPTPRPTSTPASPGGSR